ncbi:proline dehydrogenase family protein [Salmonella enterica]
MGKIKDSIYARYTTGEIAFKFFTTMLLTNNLTRKSSLHFIKKCLGSPTNRLLSLLNGIYFGGETLLQAKSTAAKLAQAGISCVLDYAVEGEADEQHFIDTLANTIELIDMATTTQNIPFVVIKPSSLGAANIYSKKSNGMVMTNSEQEAWARITGRYSALFEYAHLKGVRMMVDAEQTFVQPAVNALLLEMMRRFNAVKPTITLTLQFYLKDQLRFLEQCYHQACQFNYILGVKIVRGAYLEEEKRGDGSALCYTTKEETDTNYNQAIEFVSTRLERIAPFFATHNEVSVKKIIDNVFLKSADTWIGQLYGLGDHLSYSLNYSGLAVCKYLPYGPLKKSLPYLFRRLEENSIATATFKKENELLRKELFHRIIRMR